MKNQKIESAFGDNQKVSLFLNSSPYNEKAGINFDFAKKLPQEGSTCDCYVTRIDNRLIFVKRLKEKFRHDLMHLNAMRKEYDIAFCLRHKSLPVYLDYHEDYITMDYIDGKTLEDMIKSFDPWLIDNVNVKNMLLDLLDVIKYLHDRNVIHCDIKTDNIMLTYGNKNLFLIDLDKCYTSWYENTAGSSSKYGLKENSLKSPIQDFKGIVRILERLECLPGFPIEDFYKFKFECDSDDVKITTLESLLKGIGIEEEHEIPFRGEFKKKKIRQINKEKNTALERKNLDKMAQYVANTLELLDGPLVYIFDIESKTAEVRCRKNCLEECIEAIIPPFIEIKGEKYLVNKVCIGGFWGCVNLRKVVLPYGIEMLFRALFRGCQSLEYVRIPSTVKTILGGVFSSCFNLKRIEFEKLENIRIIDDFYFLNSNQNVEIIDVATGSSYNIDEFKNKFCLPFDQF